eukprot:CAMPEP_0198317300 /NCGR_PEP_ID=MMETSP1450-20131203/6817_1 /TAXON_ID=753684 ORGANISM="Madagascaria erythrocladiodes, Strain CCMP3234" /NCGR_SAMPLE_ID=MMETSP1450 /ASSEMBLY_ACC=CAM_ASM_001115 /LENGTH=83 /DNA_ID=CAMNT_0044020489 /DNA_START=100 /DNA_END=351 /DNA_ORIENTATION=+
MPPADSYPSEWLTSESVDQPLTSETELGQESPPARCVPTTGLHRGDGACGAGTGGSSTVSDWGFLVVASGSVRGGWLYLHVFP